MRDVFVLLMLLGSIGLTFRAPWLGVLALAVFDYMSPHRYAWGFMTTFPVYQILFLAVFTSFLIKAKERQPLPGDWRITAFFVLWFYFLITTLDAVAPNAAWAQFEKVSKIYLPFILTLWLINTREKLFYLIITMGVSIGLVAVKGGIWAIGSGFSHRVYGPPGTQIGGNNEFAIATLVVIPLLILWLREATDKRIKLALMAAIPLCVASAVSSHSRGAFLTLIVMTMVLLWNSKRKWLVAPLMLVGMVVAVQNLPEHWFSRMDTIQTYEEDQSAMQRIEAWTDGWNYALKNPLTGAGFDGWMGVTKRDWHNSYIEMMAEHGFIAFTLWFSLLFGSIIGLTSLARKAKKVPELQWVKNYSHMLRASFIAYATGTLFLGAAYWSLFYQLVFIAILLKHFALKELADYRETQDQAPEAVRARAERGLTAQY